MGVGLGGVLKFTNKELNLPTLVAWDSVWKVESMCCQLSRNKRNRTAVSNRQQESQPSQKTPDKFPVISGKHPSTCYSSSTSLYRISQSLFLFITIHAALLIKTKAHLTGSANALHSFTGHSILLLILNLTKTHSSKSIFSSSWQF